VLVQWQGSLRDYAFPVLGGLPVAAIDVGLVMRVIEPLWTTKTTTASRVRQRIEAILGWATVHGYRTGDNPAKWTNHLDKLLPAKGNVSAGGKIPHEAAGQSGCAGVKNRQQIAFVGQWQGPGDEGRGALCSGSLCGSD
jgi:hypothetical protein